MKNMIFLESTLLKEEVKIPIYFTLETPELLRYYDLLDKDQQSQSDSALNSKN